MSNRFETQHQRARRKVKSRAKKMLESMQQQALNASKPPSQRWIWFNSHITGGPVEEVHKGRAVIVNRYRLDGRVRDRSKYDGNGNKKHESEQDVVSE